MSTNTLVLRAAEHPIKSVTIFKPSNAEVVRTFKVTLAKGQNKVEIKGLSSSLDTDSIRVSGLGDSTRLDDVVCTVEHGDRSKNPFGSVSDASESIRSLRIDKKNIEKRRTIRESEAALLLQYANSLSLNGVHIAPEDMLRFVDSYISRNQNISEEVAKLDESVFELDRQIAEEEEKVKRKKGDANGHVDIVITADKEVQIDLALAYIVHNVRWKPIYELHAKTEGGKPSSSVSLHYRACVKQSTGENWTNASLTLSTVLATPRVIPSLQPVKLRPPRVAANSLIAARMANLRLMQGAGSSRAQTVDDDSLAMRGDYMRYSRARARAPAPSAPTPPASESLLHMTQELEELEQEDGGTTPVVHPKTIVNETPVALTFTVPGQCSIPSDCIDHQVSISVIPFEAAISYITVPKADPRVYLQCNVENTSEYRLLPGPVRVILDDSFVSSTTVDDVPTGESISCTLGDDPSTKITYSRTLTTVKSEGGAFSETTNTTTFHTRIEIHNKHSFDIGDIIVRDVVPICEDRHGQVVLRRPEGLAKAKEGEVVSLEDGLNVGWVKRDGDAKGTAGNDGMFEWKWKVPGGTKVVLEAEWDAKVPGELPWKEVILPVILPG